MDMQQIRQDWSRPHYTVRVRTEPIYLWGSAGISQNMQFDKPLILHVHNDLHGEQIALFTINAAGTNHALGTLSPGEVVSIPIQLIAGVYATCIAESAVTCLIK